MHAILLTTIENREKDDVELNRPFAASHSCGTKPPCWRAKVALGQDKQRNYHLKLCMSFVCFVPVRLLLSSVAVLYHVNGWLQRAYFDTFLGVRKYFVKNLHLVIYNENKNSSFHFRWKINPKRANFASYFCISLFRRCNLYRYTLICQYLLRITMESN